MKKKKNTYAEITRARKLLELPEQATLDEIRTSYRKLIRKWHPDQCQEERQRCLEVSARLNDAYALIIAYCAGYRFSFTEEAVNKHLSDEEWWLNRFGNDPLWGRGGAL
ncbi:MAG: DnaJ domain-containing protein [Desulfobacterales bacterium]|nr:DnaJ domain-containing protein [Desulfobacterales bacterium]